MTDNTKEIPKKISFRIHLKTAPSIEGIILARASFWYSSPKRYRRSPDTLLWMNRESRSRCKEPGNSLAACLLAVHVAQF